ncbi:MAG: hypothetical protein EPO55_23155 [Reyranella sp.]|uniref:hypothetical protein n=1 Tax=Reyranella sp. TaxID=1929291 RepID=UPI0011F9A74E|nr:hypothetical protein [Reyranella sp.]TAJ36091.1 MAG: hypothetical protein EPO55_23155 [Reyranella sp.]
MTRIRTLVWLIALAAFVVPSFGAAAASHAMTPSMTHGAQVASVECPDHAPPPQDCPAQGTAKHAAGQCCPMMSCTVAVLPPASAGVAPAPLHAWLSAPVRSLTGLTFTQDPPPPRV